MATVALVGTCDTKLEELLFLRSQILQHEGLQVLMIDVGRNPVSHEAITITQPELISEYRGDDTTLGPSTLPRGDLIKFMSSCATKAIQSLFSAGLIHGIISAGGSGGTSLAATAMRSALPIGFPKLIVSTVASGNTGPYVGEADIAMLYSVVDIAGLNSVLREVLSNAAASIAAAAQGYALRHSQSAVQPDETEKKKKRIGITMFGVTTPAVDAIRRYLPQDKYETLVFHATGHGGRAMERLIREGAIDAVIDLTTTEICDLIVPGGVMSAGPGRLSAAAEAGIPCLVSLGATDMVNFGPKETVPERYAGRKLYVHNPAVTLMRVDIEEARKVGEFIAGKLKGSKEPRMVQMWIPRGGVSVISKAGGIFEDKKADEVLFETIREGLKGSVVRVVDDERDINDEEFARDIAGALDDLVGKS
ncbi:hypothetical protein B0T16DRAFT_31225 [Cercophora newfieldiana]|uniref:Uncharacterized protein n=1 Tax=Cercophora newfieldiana TaxID=92897 RepID=A0AA40CZF7_9PEZI|nr:hypothetical protein B0T16DRAFT_31225 [Cercophora newfieldiana]